MTPVAAVIVVRSAATADAHVGRVRAAGSHAVRGDDGRSSSSLRRVLQGLLEQEAVELGLRQRIGALLLDRVLGRHHREAFGERVGLAVDGDVALLHRLQERGLGLGRRAVDLVGQQQLAEDRPARQREGRSLEVEEVGPDDVARHQVGRELDAAVVQPERAGEALGEEGLGGAGRAFQQHVAARHQRGQHQIDGVGLADHRLADLRTYAVGEVLHVTDVHASSPVSIDRGARPAR